VWSDDAQPWPRDLPACDGFDFPVGKPDAVGYYDAQPFGVTRHLGNDWNGNGGRDTDLGDPVYAAATGIVISAVDVGFDWGNSSASHTAAASKPSTRTSARSRPTPAHSCSAAIGSA
jgi:hypothetical protein